MVDGRPSKWHLLPTFLSVVVAGWLLWVAIGTDGGTSLSDAPTHSPAATQTARIVVHRVPVTTTPSPLPTMAPWQLTAEVAALTPQPTLAPYVSPTPTSVFVKNDTGADR